MLLARVIALALLAAACGGSAVAPPVMPSPSPAPPLTSASSPPSPSSVPAGVEVVELDVGAADLAPEELVPARADVTGTWILAGGSAETLLVAWSRRSPDPLVSGHGYALFRRMPDLGQWWGVYRRDIGRRAGVFGVSALTADLTGDGAEDALVLEQTGGTGACGTYRVIDAEAAESVFERLVCDTRIAPSTAPVGIAMRRAVYGPDDPHCCPSGIRTTILVYEGGGSWAKDSVTDEPA
jgi:hypothetical protein